MKIAERFSNMMVFTNGDTDMRRELLADYEHHMRNTLGTPDVLCVVFNDDSMFMSIKGEIVVTEDADEGAAFLHWFLDHEPDVAVPFIGKMIERVKTMLGEQA